MVAVRSAFSPEFINRVDCIITYQPLSLEALSAILDQQIADLQNHVNTRWGTLVRARGTARNPPVLLERGTSAEYGRAN